jgi:chromosome segregation ATPase
VGTRRIERNLRKTSARLRALRDELRVVDEQLAQLDDDAGDLEIRALVADAPGVGVEHQHAQAHADAMAAHRRHILAEITELERRQDVLLDALTAR